MVTKADKDNTMMITYTSDYNKKINSFINSNNFIQDTGNFGARGGAVG